MAENFRLNNMNVMWGNLLVGTIEQDTHGFWFVSNTESKYKIRFSAYQLRKLINLVEAIEKINK